MRIYIKGYRFGDGDLGYISKSIDFPGGELREINFGAMPKKEAELWDRTGAIIFLGRPDRAVFGMVRNIETAYKEDNGRECFFNIAFEEDDDGETVRSLIWYAYKHKTSFDAFINNIVLYKENDFLLHKPNMEQLIKTAMEEAVLPEKTAKRIELLVPEISVGGFLYTMDNEYTENDIENNATLAALEAEKKDVNIYFYCSTPSMGFITRQIDYYTGLKISRSVSENESMLPYAYKLMLCDGITAALFEQNGRLCLVVRQIIDQKPDQHGRKKRMSLVVDVASAGDREWLSAMAAQFAASHGTMAGKLLEAISVFEGNVGFDVNKDKLSEFLNIPSAAPAGEARKIFDAVKNSDDEFKLIVTEFNMEYIERTSGIRIDGKKIGTLLEGYSHVLKDMVEPKPEPGTETELEPEPEPEPEPELKPDKDNKTDKINKEDYIDLLDYKWFLPAVFGGIAVVAAVILIYIRFH